MHPAVVPTQKLRVYNEVFDHHMDELIQHWTGRQKQLKGRKF